MTKSKYISLNHGYSGYTRGCRCDVCSAGSRAYAETYKAKRGSIPCAFPGCLVPSHALDLCSGHWNQQHKGRPLTELRGIARVVDGFKVCGRCGQRLPVSQFSIKGRYVQPWCKDCRNIDERVRAYGLTRDEVIALMARPCDVCGAQVTGKDQHIDHCHAEGHVRGVLCNKCNTALGAVKDDVEVLRGLIAYLERSRS